MPSSYIEKDKGVSDRVGLIVSTCTGKRVVLLVVYYALRILELFGQQIDTILVDG